MFFCFGPVTFPGCTSASHHMTAGKMASQDGGMWENPTKPSAHKDAYEWLLLQQHQEAHKSPARLTRDMVAILCQLIGEGRRNVTPPATCISIYNHLMRRKEKGRSKRKRWNKPARWLWWWFWLRHRPFSAGNPLSDQQHVIMMSGATKQTQCLCCSSSGNSAIYIFSNGSHWTVDSGWHR